MKKLKGLRALNPATRRAAALVALAVLLAAVIPLIPTPDAANALGAAIRSGSLGGLGSSAMSGSEVTKQTTNGDHFLKTLTDPNVVIVGDDYANGDKGQFWHFVNGDGKSVTLTFAPTSNRSDPNSISVEVNAMSTANPSGKHYGVVTPSGWYLVDAYWTSATGGNFTLSHMEPFTINENSSGSGKGAGGGNELPVLPPARISVQKRIVATPSGLSSIPSSGVYTVVLTPTSYSGAPITFELKRSNGWAINNRYIKAGTYTVTEKDNEGNAIDEYEIEFPGASSNSITLGLRSNMTLRVNNANALPDPITPPAGGGAEPPPAEPDTGFLQVAKAFPEHHDYHTDWDIDYHTQFTAQLNIYVKDYSSGESYVYSYESDTAASGLTNTIKFSEGSPAIIMSIPAGKVVTVAETGVAMGVNGFSGVTYTVGAGAPQSSGSVTIKKDDCVEMVVTNTYQFAVGSMEVKKTVTGDVAASDIGETVWITVWDEDGDGGAGASGQEQLLFRSKPESDGSHWCIGHITSGGNYVLFSEADEIALDSGTADWEVWDKVPLKTNGEVLVLSDLWAHREYSVVEVDPPEVTGYTRTTTYSGNAIGSSNNIITITNNYSDGTTSPSPSSPGPSTSPTTTSPTTNTPYYPPIDPPPSSSQSPSPSPSASPSPSTSPSPSPENSPGPGDDDGDDGDDGNGGGGDYDGPGGSDGFGDSDGPGGPGDAFNPFITPLSEGGYDHDVPPLPRVPGHDIVFVDDDHYIEFDDFGVPLGEWHWDDDDDMWIFDPFPPLAALPQTGAPENLPLYFAVFGLIAIAVGIVLRDRRRMRIIRECW